VLLEEDDPEGLGWKGLIEVGVVGAAGPVFELPVGGDEDD
jgi:hypothetical protein